MKCLESKSFLSTRWTIQRLLDTFTCDYMFIMLSNSAEFFVFYNFTTRGLLPTERFFLSRLLNTAGTTCSVSSDKKRMLKRTWNSGLLADRIIELEMRKINHQVASLISCWLGYKKKATSPKQTSLPIWPTISQLSQNNSLRKQFDNIIIQFKEKYKTNIVMI